MGLLDGIAGQVLGSLGSLGSLGGSGSAQPTGIVQAIGGLIARFPGGLTGLVSAFQRNGLGGVVASWIGTGANLPISAEQLQSVLGSDQLGAVASSLGLSQPEAAAKLAQALPDVVDKLTPSGTVPEGGALGKLLGAFGG